MERSQNSFQLAGFCGIDFELIDKAGGAPIFRHGIGLAVDHAFRREALLLCRGVVIWKLGEIEFLDEVQFLVGRDRVVGGHEDVPAGGARLQLGQHFFIRAEHRDVDLDAGVLGELVDVFLGKIAGPGREIHRAGQCGIGLARLEAGHGAAQHGGS